MAREFRCQHLSEETPVLNRDLDQIRELVGELSRAQPDATFAWHDWTADRITGGGNNLLYRADRGGDSFAVKFTTPGPRERAEREYDALTLLERHGHRLAPAPILFDRQAYRWPVVVQRWVEGPVSSEPPASDDDWQKLVDHYLSLHLVEAVDDLRPAMQSCTSEADALKLFAGSLALIPVEHRSPPISDLGARVASIVPREWRSPPRVLCRCDANVQNFIQLPDGWISVDWENSGWGDAALEVAELMVHPAYGPATPERGDWLLETYCRGSSDAGIADRARAYYPLYLAWFATRCARMLYDIPRGLDVRLADWPETWEADTVKKCLTYLERANVALDQRKS